MLVGLQSKTVPPLNFEEKWIKAKVIKVTFKNVYKCCLEQAALPLNGPHYIEGDKLVGDNYSKKPVVYPLNDHKKVQAEVIVNMEVKNMSGTATLRGKINGHVFEGSIPIKDGDSAPIKVSLILETTKKLQWNHGNIAWSIETTDNRTFMAGKSVTELLFVFDDPSKRQFFSTKGVWVEALRFLYEEAKMSRVEDKDKAISKVTQACFTKKGRSYERTQGGDRFGGASGTFKLEKYLSPIKEDVNCYDQTYAVVIFSGALGVEIDELFMQPFGYLKTIGLVGYGDCNNPFIGGFSLFHAYGYTGDARLIVNNDDPNRSAFGNHMFCEYNSKIYDACAGPAKGNYDKVGYIGRSVDSSTNLNNLANQALNRPDYFPGKSIVPSAYKVYSVK